MKYRHDPEFSHPLTETVIAAFADREVHDSCTLSECLAGCSTLKVGRSKQDGMHAYRLVAEDVLGVMHLGGLLDKTEEGWYKLNTKN